MKLFYLVTFIASTLNVMFDLTIRINWRIPQNVSYTPNTGAFPLKTGFLPSQLQQGIL